MNVVAPPAASVIATVEAGPSEIDASSAPPAPTPESAPPVPEDGYEVDQADARPFGALCRGPWRGVGENHPYRGVRPEDNGGGECCPLDGRAFLCVITPGHQHVQFIYEHARFFDGTSAQPRVAFPAAVSENQGMSNPSRAVLALQAVPTRGGFLLRPDAARCRRPTTEVRDVCKAAGSYTWRDTLPVRVP
jgi:hypothetical protein